LAAANLAWLLASGGARVLALDWNFDAPRLAEPFRPFWPGRDPRHEPGVIDGLWDYVLTQRRSVHTTAVSVPSVATFHDSTQTLDCQFPRAGRLDFLNIGRSTSYGIRNQLFPWEPFFEELSGQGLIDELRRSMRERYDYVLVDAPVLLEDRGGICFVLLPDRVVLGLTAGGQDAAAARPLIRKIRSAMSSLYVDRSIRVTPVLMRTEYRELGLLMEAKERIRNDLEGLEGVEFRADLDVPSIPYIQYREALAPYLPSDSLYSAYASILSEVLDVEAPPMPVLRDEYRIQVVDQYAKPAEPLPLSSTWSLFEPKEKLKPFAGLEGYLFVSYARKDFERIALALDQIQQLGYLAWWDTGIEPGDNWKDVLRQRLQRCRGVVLFATMGASRSSWVKWELSEAKHLGKRILPIKLDNVDPGSEVGLILASHQHVMDPGVAASPELELGLRRLVV
jgi:TIR domain